MVNKTHCKHKLVYILWPWCWFLVQTGSGQIGQGREKAKAVRQETWDQPCVFRINHQEDKPHAMSGLKGLHHCSLYIKKTKYEHLCLWVKVWVEMRLIREEWKLLDCENLSVFPCPGVVIWVVIRALLWTWLNSFTHSLLCPVACWCCKQEYFLLLPKARNLHVILAAVTGVLGCVSATI